MIPSPKLRIILKSEQVCKVTGSKVTGRVIPSPKLRIILKSEQVCKVDARLQEARLQEE